MNWITKTFRQYGIKFESNPICNLCGKGLKEHTDDELESCSNGK